MAWIRPENRGLPGSEAIRKDLSILDPSRKAGRRTALYYVDKFQNLLLFIIAADLLALAAWFGAQGNGILSEDGAVIRPDYGEDDLEVSLMAESADEEIVYGEYTVVISAREYTEEEAESLAAELMESLETFILGDNESLDQITSDMNLIKEVEGYPFVISWKSSSNEWIETDGTVHPEQIDSDSKGTVFLTAKLKYLEWSWEKEIEITICPLDLTEEEQRDQDIQNALEQSNEATVLDENYYLPEEAGDSRLIWTETVEDSSALLFGLILAAGIAVFILGDRELHQALEQREKQMALDYPKIISKLVLFLGAGMSVRNAFVRLGENYMDNRKKGGEKRYVYEEILLVCRELDSGISESTAYVNFGVRCRSRQYTKLCSLLTQNLKKGNNALLQVLQEEAELAFEERRSQARRMGEEAGTRLLLPMILMLAVTLIIIMVPAYLSFSL